MGQMIPDPVYLHMIKERGNNFNNNMPKQVIYCCGEMRKYNVF